MFGLCSLVCLCEVLVSWVLKVISVFSFGLLVGWLVVVSMVWVKLW